MKIKEGTVLLLNLKVFSVISRLPFHSCVREDTEVMILVLGECSVITDADLRHGLISRVIAFHYRLLFLPRRSNSFRLSLTSYETVCMYIFEKQWVGWWWGCYYRQAEDINEKRTGIGHTCHQNRGLIICVFLATLITIKIPSYTQKRPQINTLSLHIWAFPIEKMYQAILLLWQ